jgi:cytochrome c oxidase cbb3-type subunit 3
MSSAWTIYVTVLTVVMIVGCTWLLWVTSRPARGEGETTGHVWDDDLREYNKPLPRWWLVLFYATILFTIGYLVWYPGLGGFEGIGGWTSAKEHDAARAEAEAKLAPLFARFEYMQVEDIARVRSSATTARNATAPTPAAPSASPT